MKIRRVLSDRSSQGGKSSQQSAAFLEAGIQKMQSPRALLIDLDDTLLDDRGAMADAVLAFRQKHGLCNEEGDDFISARWDSIGREVWRKLALGELTFVEQRRIRLRETFLLTLSDIEADELFESYLECYERSWRLLPGADLFLERTSHLPWRSA